MGQSCAGGAPSAGAADRDFAGPDPLQVWADLDYGGLNILAQLRKLISPRFLPYRMDAATLEAHIRWARPLTENDRRLLARLQGYASLADMQPVIAHVLERGLKLEQEAVQWAGQLPPPRSIPLTMSLAVNGCI